MKLLQNADTRVGYAASFFLQNQENVRKKRIVQQISIAYNEITSCVVALREMEKKLFDILKIVQKNPVFGKTLMCGDMLDEERMGSYMRFSMRSTGRSLRILEMTSFSMAV